MFVRLPPTTSLLRRCLLRKLPHPQYSIRSFNSSTFVHQEQLLQAEQENAADEIKTFSEAGVSDARVSLLAQMGISKMFPIQEKTYSLIKDGTDVVGRAKTGSGKTIAFALPLIERYESTTPVENGSPTIMILTPTRELAMQVHTQIETIAPRLNTCCIYGGQPVGIQTRKLERKIDIVVGTPGRTIHFLQEGILKVNNVKALVLDEADQMLDIGFKLDVEEIMKTMPKEKQTLLFSATVPHWVQELTSSYLRSPKFIDLIGSQATPTEVTHGFIEIPMPSQRIVALSQLVAKHRDGKMLIFVDTKLECAQLSAHPLITLRSVRALHGDINQQDRATILDSFRSGNCKILIATDVAARGLDIPGVDVVIHYRPPQKLEAYIHRSGRCGRAGKIGTSITLITRSDYQVLKDIEKRIGTNLKEFPVPSQEEIAKINSDSLTELLKKVPESVSNQYLSTAKILSREDSVNFLAAALALLSGKTSNTNYSMISGAEGFTTLELLPSGNRPLTKFHALSFLRNLLENLNVSQAFTTKQGSVVVDVQSDQVSDLLANCESQTNSETTVRIVTEFPDLSLPAPKSPIHREREAPSRFRRESQPRSHNSNYNFSSRSNSPRNNYREDRRREDRYRENNYQRREDNYHRREPDNLYKFDKIFSKRK